MKKLLVLLLVFCLLSSAACAETAVFGDKMKVVNCKEYITLRERPETSAKALAQIPLGEEVTWFSLGEEVSWIFQPYDVFSYVSYDGKVGYVLDEYLSLLPEEEIPPMTIFVPEGEAPEVNYDIGSVHTVNCYIATEAELKFHELRTVLLEGDEVVLLSRCEDSYNVKASDYIEYNKMRMYVPDGSLDLKEGFRGPRKELNSVERYRLNEFLSYLSETYEWFYHQRAYDTEVNAYEDEMMRMVFTYILQHHYPELVVFDDDESGFAGYNIRFQSACLDSAIDRFFDCPSGESYDDVEYQYVSVGESDYWGFSCVDTVEALGDDRYAVRFHVYNNWDNKYDPQFNDDDWDDPVWNSNNCHLTPAQAASIDDPFCSGFAIIHAPDGLESSRNWTTEYYVMG